MKLIESFRYIIKEKELVEQRWNFPKVIDAFLDILDQHVDVPDIHKGAIKSDMMTWYKKNIDLVYDLIKADYLYPGREED